MKVPYLKGYELHEIHPVKFGGSPINLNNKTPLTRIEHMEYTKFWNEILKRIKK